MINNNIKEIPSNIYEFSKFFLKKYKIRLFFVLFVSIFSAVFVNFFPAYVLKIIVASYENKTLNLYSGFFYVFLYILSYSSYPLFDILKNKLNLITTKLIERDITNKVFNSMLHYDINFFNDNYSGDLSYKFNKMIVNFNSFILTNISIISYTLFFLVLLIIISSVSFYMFLISIIWLISFYFFLNKVAKFRKEKLEIVNKNIGMSSAIINDSLVNIGNIKSFVKERKEILNIKKQSLKIMKSQKETIFPTSLMLITIYFFQNIYSFIMFAFSFYLLKQDKIDLAEFMFLFQLILLSIGYIRTNLQNIFSLNEITAGLKDSLDRLITEIKIQDKKDAEKLVVNNGKIVFKNILFSYN